MNRMLVLLIGCLAITLSPDRASATDPDNSCQGSNDSHQNTNQRRAYRINSDFSPIANVSDLAGRYAVTTAGDTWAHQANSGYFEVTSLTAAREVNCNLPDASVVHVVDGCYMDFPDRYWIAVANARCGGSHFEIRIFSRYRLDNNTCGGLVPWTTGAVAGGEIDLLGVVLHEFGHALGIGHPKDDSEVHGAVMRPGGFTGHTMKRDLYHWDMNCAEEKGGERNLVAYRRFHNSNNTFSSESNYLGTWRVSRATPGVTRHHDTGNLHWSSAFNRESHNPYTAWTRNLNQSDTHLLDMYPVPIGPRHATWQDVSVTDARIVWTDRNERPALYATTSVLPVRTSWSSDGWQSQATLDLMECTSPTGWMGCGFFSWQSIHSPRMIASAWLSSLSRPVVAWTNHHRSDESLNRQVRVSVGTLGPWVLSQSDSLGIASSVGPGLACHKEQAGGYDCLLAYVESTTTMNQIRIKRFSVEAGLNRYVVVPESGYHTTPYRTGSDIALWYHPSTARFFLGVRSSLPSGVGQRIDVYSSASGATGTWEHEEFLGYGATGPTAVSDWFLGNNLLAVVR